MAITQYSQYSQYSQFTQYSNLITSTTKNPLNPIKTPLILLFTFLNLIYPTNSQMDYFSTFQTNYSMINKTYSTVTISESIDIGVCSCDLTPGSCDNLCCCDKDCPEKVTSLWIADQNNVCLDKSK